MFQVKSEEKEVYIRKLSLEKKVSNDDSSTYEIDYTINLLFAPTRFIKPETYDPEGDVGKSFTARPFHFSNTLVDINLVRAITKVLSQNVEHGFSSVKKDDKPRIILF
ncbi:MAG: hypothetical protein N2504_01880 [candidate division WOR-3 bacterium]|nr:hypothetical protein [candidate division WOR-3 bacterium]